MTAATDQTPGPIDCELYEWQADALGLSPGAPPKVWKRWTAWFCGTGSGKSYAGAVWLLIQQIEAAKRAAAEKRHRRRLPTTLAVAPTFSSLRRYMVASLLEITNGTIYQGRYNENLHEFYWPAAAGGGVTICASFDNKESVKRAEGGQYDAAWCDEAGMTPDQAYAVLRARTGVRRGPILLTSYWYAPINWCYREIWKRFEMGESDIEVLNLNSEVNPDYPREEIEAARQTLHPALFAMRYRARPEQMVGLVYGSAWNPADPVLHCDPFEIPSDWPCWGGIDQGYSPDPFHAVLLAQDPNGARAEYAFGEYRDHAQLSSDHARSLTILAYRLGVAHQLRRAYCDPANKQGWNDLRAELRKVRVRPEAIPDLPARYRRLINSASPTDRFRVLTGDGQYLKPLDTAVLPADNAVDSGIESVYSAFKSYKLRVMRGRCPEFVRELGLYHRDDQGVIVDKDDHGPDALRYGHFTWSRRTVNKQRDAHTEAKLSLVAVEEEDV